MPSDGERAVDRELEQQLDRLLAILEVRGVISGDESAWIERGDRDLLESVTDGLSDAEKRRVLDEQDQALEKLDEKGVIEEMAPEERP